MNAIFLYTIYYRDILMGVNICLTNLGCVATGTTLSYFIENIITFTIILLPLVIGLSIGAIYGKNWNDPKYKNLKKPAYNPPSYLFGIVWPILYLAIGIIYSYALYDYKKAGRSGGTGSGGSGGGASFVYYKELKYWVIPMLALLFNFLYIPVFFGENGLFNGIVIIILSLVFAILTMIQFYLQKNSNDSIKYFAILALLPYVAWLSFATYLSYNIWVMNVK
jgi:tryptophan-rich sensory protein